MAYMPRITLEWWRFSIWQTINPPVMEETEFIETVLSISGFICRQIKYRISGCPIFVDTK
jgi:hypothetical protein